MNSKFLDWGLLIIRLGMGAVFIMHGQQKVFAGSEMWTRIGGTMAQFGINFAPTAWGAAAAFSEFGGGILLVLGLFFRPAAAAMAFTMLVALGHHLKAGDGFDKWHDAGQCLAVFIGLTLTGPGSFAIRKK